jgi:hypothetical protein
MRVRASDEHGAAAVMLAILMVVFLAFLALAIDGGLLLVKFRQVRRANDAAALAAALSCARGDGSSAANAQADSLAGANVDSSQRISIVYGPSGGPECDPRGGEVTVTYRATQSLLFGPAVGEASRPVQRSATAAWGGAGDASSVAPLMLNMDRLGTCNITNPPSPSLQIGITQCVFYWNNSSAFDGNGMWALMNLDPYNNKGTQWYVPPDYNCPGTGGNDIKGWLSQGYPGDLFLNPNGKTYVCKGTGFQVGPVEQGLSGAEGKMYAFPVNNPAEQVDRNGVVCPPTCSPDKFSIIGFAWLRLDHYLTDDKNPHQVDADDLLWDQYCSQFVRDANARCIVTTWMGFSTSVSSTVGGGNFGVVSTYLKG